MNLTIGTVRPAGKIRLDYSQNWPGDPSLREVIRHGFPRLGLAEGVALWRLRNLPNLWRGLWRLALARLFHIPTHFGVVWIRARRPDGRWVDLGLASLRVVTDAGVAFIVDALHANATIANLKYHGFGTGTTAEATGDTALVTEMTTAYNPDSTRPTGSQTEGATANIYRSVATVTPDANATITEHGIFDQAATGGGTLLDRSKWAAAGVIGPTGDYTALTVTYDLTLTSGG